jgi:hypothetical protein
MNACSGLSVFSSLGYLLICSIFHFFKSKCHFCSKISEHTGFPGYAGIILGSMTVLLYFVGSEAWVM